jgi:hypothetical protein
MAGVNRRYLSMIKAAPLPGSCLFCILDDVYTIPFSIARMISSPFTIVRTLAP